MSRKIPDKNKKTNISRKIEKSIDIEKSICYNAITNRKEVIDMNEKAVIKDIMHLRNWSQAMLAKESGFKSQSNITGLLNNNKNGIRTDNLVKMLNAMGCELVVRDKMGSKEEWVIDQCDEETPIDDSAIRTDSGKFKLV